MDTLTERLTKRLEDEICSVCVHQTADHGCTLTEHRECPVFYWVEQLAPLVDTIKSNRVDRYEKEIREIICPQCSQDDDGYCDDRQHLNCPIDLYLGLIIRIIEEEIARSPSSGADSETP